MPGGDDLAWTSFSSKASKIPLIVKILTKAENLLLKKEAYAKRN
jgi:hypothetical protein